MSQNQKRTSVKRPSDTAPHADHARRDGITIITEAAEEEIEWAKYCSDSIQK